ncbi:MAG: phosphatidylglycerol lysyltransferase domain-containing protein [Bacillota bacterium]|nr:phosphatidylglycerol lysyltransferase domain-containing protein [Bacillota bacterium]
MDFQLLKLEDKELVNSYLAGTEPRLISYNFTNFYLYRNWEPYRWAVVDKALVFKSEYRGYDNILVPISADEQAILAATERMIDWFARRGAEFIISEVSDDALTLYEKYWPGRFRAEEYRGGFNYIYLRDQLLNLSGRKFAPKRNHLRRFRENNPGHQLLPLDAAMTASCKQQAQRWRQLRGGANPELDYELCGIIDALDNFASLDSVGCCVVIDGKLEGFCFGEPLNSDTFCVHIEKANTEIAGIYQALNQAFVRDYTAGYTYINRAEDMDDAGQRRAKLSYNPCRLEKYYYLRLAQ